MKSLDLSIFYWEMLAFFYNGSVNQTKNKKKPGISNVTRKKVAFTMYIHWHLLSVASAIINYVLYTSTSTVEWDRTKEWERNS